MRRDVMLTPFLSMLASGAVLSGCALSVDTSLIRQDAGDEEEQVSESDAGSALEPDEYAESDRQDTKVDAGQVGGDASVGRESNLRDAALVDATPPEPQPVVCTRDTDCAAQEQCAFEECSASGCHRTCQPRCDEQYGCAGPWVNTAQYLLPIAAAGGTLYWSTPPDRDTLGNLLNGGRIWSWRRSAPDSAPVERDTGELLLIADDYLYFRRPAALGAPATVLFRKSLVVQDAPATQLATDVVSVWKTAGHVVWSRTEGSSEELWRLSRASAAPAERVAATQTGHWSSSNATLAIKSLAFMPNESIHSVRHTVIRLSDQVELGSVDTGFSDNEDSEADEDYLYFQYDNGLRRASFASLSQQLILARVMEVGVATLKFELDGSWIYWQNAFPGGGGRSQRDLTVNPPEKLVVSGPRTARIKNEIFYAYDWHIFYKSMTPLACSAAAACPTDMTCSASMVCE